MTMSAELLLGIIGAADSCIKLANKALSTCRAYRHVEDDVEKKVAILETVWMKLEYQLNFLRLLSEGGKLNDELARFHFTLLQKLQGALLQAISQLEVAASSVRSNTKVLSFFKPGKFRYALVKDTLDSLVAELEAWQSRFDPSWYFIILIGGAVLDPLLEQSQRNRRADTNARPGPLDTMLALRRAIEAETAGTVQHPVSLVFDASRLAGIQGTILMQYTSARTLVQASGELLILEPVDISAGVTPQSLSDVENLARRLQGIDPDTFGLLRCEGVLRETDPQRGELARLEVVYRAPPSTQPPTTLRHLLLTQKEVSLNAIVDLAKQLVRSVSYVHACSFVHKNIRPENILLFPTTTTTASSPLGAAYLLGFTHFRSLAHQTNLHGDAAWHRNLYRHPARQGLNILDEYVMQHDIYSLGVCLLEIGLWRPLVWYPLTSTNNNNNNSEVVGNGGGRRDEVRRDVAPVPGMVLQLRKPLTDKVFERAHKGDRTGWVKEGLMDMARGLLPARMGLLYTGIVESCLTCLDEGNDEFGAFTEGEAVDGVTVGVRFVEKILLKMGEIRV